MIFAEEFEQNVLSMFIGDDESREPFSIKAYIAYLDQLLDYYPAWGVGKILDELEIPYQPSTAREKLRHNYTDRRVIEQLLKDWNIR